MIAEKLIGLPLAEATTPALVLDLDAAEANIAAMAAWFRGRPCQLRPHLKTHKLPLLARKQLAAGAIGLTCAKLSEAAIFLEAGLPDLLIANQVVGREKVRRLAHLAAFGRLTVAVDDAANAQDLALAAREAGTTLGVLVEVNVGLNRCGVAPGEPAAALAQRVADLKGLEFRGVMGYEGGLYLPDPAAKAARCRAANERLTATAEAVRAAGLAVEVVSAGGTNTYKISGACPGITDVQVGSYVTMDAHNLEAGLTEFKPALFVLTSVISRPERGRAITDAGRKALSTDAGSPLCARPGITVAALSEEHGHLAVDPALADPRPGDKIELIPGHGCTTIPLHDRYVLARAGVVVGLAKIEARGALS